MENNENFYIGKQWEGVVSNGLPTPTFNFIRRIVLYLVASTSTDNLKINATPLAFAGTGGDGPDGMRGAEELCGVVNRQFEILFEQGKVGGLVRDFMRNAAVDGDACLYAWFDPEAETGQAAKGGIKTELLENTRVFFGDPNSLDVQAQPYLLISRREQVSAVRRRAEKNGGDAQGIRPDGDDAGSRFDAMTDGKCTTVLRLWKSRETAPYGPASAPGRLRAPGPGTRSSNAKPVCGCPGTTCRAATTGGGGYRPHPQTRCFVNKMFAMTMISLMTTAYPRWLRQTRIAKWDSRVGAAIGGERRGHGKRGRDGGPGGPSPPGEPVYPAVGFDDQGIFGRHRRRAGNVEAGQHLGHHRPAEGLVGAMELVRQNLYQCIE